MADDDCFTPTVARQRLQQTNAGQSTGPSRSRSLHRRKANYKLAKVPPSSRCCPRSPTAVPVGLHNQYIRSQQPSSRQRPPPRNGIARPWDPMTWDDALDLARNSQYGKDLDHNDPHVQAGYREVARRRARGE